MMKEEGMDRKGALELTAYILKRLKGVARDLDDHGHEDLSKILFVKASEIDDEICKIETKETAEAFNEVRNQGYNQALTDIRDLYVRRYGTENDFVANIDGVINTLKR